MSNWTKRFIMALIVIVLAFAYIFVITLVSDAKTNDIITGSILTTCLATVLNFFFGSSDKKGKDDKDPVDPGDKPPTPVIKPDGL